MMMKAAAASVAVCCATASTTLAFQAATPLTMMTPSPVTQPMSARRSASSAASLKLHGALSPVDDDADDTTDAADNVLSSEGPKVLGPKRTFLGLRRESGIMRRMSMEQQSQQQSVISTTGSATSTTSTALASSATALMPDGGLSPCVIKVLGVGGGGSNAVRVTEVYHK